MIDYIILAEYVEICFPDIIKKHYVRIVGLKQMLKE